MTYDATERSIQDGEPVELFRFAKGVVSFTYTSANESITFNNETYEPRAISRSEISETERVDKSPITVTAARDIEISTEFIGDIPPLPITLTIFRTHRADGEFITFWKGRVAGHDFQGSRLVLNCESILTSLRRAGLRRHYTPNCPHTHYDSGCRVVKTLFQSTGTLDSVNGVTLTGSIFSAQADGFFTGGELEFGDEKRLIRTHVMDTITISRPITGLVAGNEVDAFAGCDHTLTTCINKFNNLVNFGGFPLIPRKNPFSGDAIV